MPQQNQPLTKQHLEIVTALMQVLEKNTAIRFLRTCRKQDDEVYHFGFDESQPAAPYFKLQILGGGMGDYYSGTMEYQDVFTIQNMTKVNGWPFRFEYDHQSTDLAGDCSRFDSNAFTEEELQKIETEFYSLLRAGVEVSAACLALIQ